MAGLLLFVFSLVPVLIFSLVTIAGVPLATIIVVSLVTVLFPMDAGLVCRETTSKKTSMRIYGEVIRSYRAVPEAHDDHGVANDHLQWKPPTEHEAKDAMSNATCSQFRCRTRRPLIGFYSLEFAL
jgi:hypothetical protein